MPHAIQIRQTGGPEVLNWTAVDVGEPGTGQARLRQAAAGLNYIDVYHRTGYYPQPLPFIPGLEGAGTVEAVAQDVRGLKVGDRVAYAGPTGGYSEVRLIEADRLVRLPEAISFDQAAAMMLQGMTAQVLIRQVYPVKAGDLILVHAAAGGTGLILCQWAAALGATVIGTVSTEAKAEMAHAHGCNHTILYTKQDFVAEVSRISGGEKLPVVFDCVGKDTFLRSLRLSTTTRIDGDLRTSFRSHRPYCTRSTVAEGFALSDAPNPLPLHRATRCARSFRERAVRGGRFGKGAH